MIQTWNTLDELSEMCGRLEREWRHWESVKQADRELRRRELSFATTEAWEAWLAVVTDIKALELLKDLGWGIDEARLDELKQEADAIVTEDETDDDPEYFGIGGELAWKPGEEASV